jgi:anti-sigma regulatory factor (Ser/Thr protein kinase)
LTPPICHLPAGVRPERTCTLVPGALVIAYSDGLVERRRVPVDAGIDRLAVAAKDAADAPISAVAEQIIATMAADAPYEDDVVVVCFRYTPEVARFERQMTARADQLAPMRKALRAWLNDRNIAGRVHDDVLLCVGEACANAIEHAYECSGIGDIDVAITDHRQHVHISVADRGHWRVASSSKAPGGRGIPIMRALTSRFDHRTTATGTTVTMIVDVGLRP